MLFKLSNLNSNLALTLGYLNPALNNLALIYTVVWLILTLKCSEHVFKILISHCCFNKDNCLNRLLTSKTVVLYVTGLSQYQTTSGSVANEPVVMCLHWRYWLLLTLNLVYCYSGRSRGGAQMTPPPPLPYLKGWIHQCVIPLEQR